MRHAELYLAETQRGGQDLARSIVRGRPERRSSSRPSTLRAAYRSRQPITVGRDTPTQSAISVLDTPSARRAARSGPAAPDPL